MSDASAREAGNRASNERPVEVGWFDAVAAFLGPTYWAPDTGRVMSFTTGTEQEVDFLVDALGLEAGMRVLDVGCGPGRHARAGAVAGGARPLSTV